MNYKNHYNKLIDRAKDKILDEYTENHHVVPRCLGGDDSPENLVRLTPEEHYLAHLLLVKIYPDHNGLVWAAIQMTGHMNGQRSNNKLYGWLRRKYQAVAKTRIGDKNGSYGTMWINKVGTNENRKVSKNSDIPEGWVRGRKNKMRYCEICGDYVESNKAKYCAGCRYSDEKCVAIERFKQFILSDVDSLRKFAKTINVSQPLLTRTWKKHIDGYSELMDDHGGKRLTKGDYACLVQW